MSAKLTHLIRIESEPKKIVNELITTFPRRFRRENEYIFNNYNKFDKIQGF
jgi:hypothetical protein